MKAKGSAQGHAVATTIPPQLARAVSEATHPVQSTFDGPALYQLEEYLAHPHEAQAVYHALLQRASAEPISLAVVLRSVDVLKRCLQRYQPSEDVLESILEFCNELASNFANSQPDLQKSVLYLQTLALSLVQGKESSSGRVQHARGISEPALLRQRGSSSSAGGPIDIRRSISHPEGNSYARLVATSSSSFSADPRNASFASARLSQPLPHSSSHAHDLLSWRWAEPDVLMPGLASSLNGDLQRFQISAAHTNTSTTPANQAQGISNEVQVIRKRQRDQSLLARNVDQGNQRPKPRDNRPRLLFQHQPYSEQEKLDLSDVEISAVLEGILDVADGDTRIWGERDVLDFREGQGRHSSQNEQPSRLCASILIKLLLDLWTLNQASVSFPLALMMLSGGLESPSANARAKTFDVIYNASIHSEFLYPAETSTFELEAQATEAVAREVGDTALLEDIREKAAETLGANGIVSPSIAAESVPEDVSTTNKQHFLEWLRLLLYQIILQIKGSEEQAEEVWTAALGAFLQLTVDNGDPESSSLSEVPASILSVFLDRCVHYHWSELVHSQLIRMATRALYLNAHSQGQSPQGTPLALDKLQDFGGVHEVMVHFKQAPCEEAARNLMAVILDHLVQQYIAIQVGEAAAEEVLQNASLLGFALSQDKLVTFLQGACLCAWPKFGARFSAALTAMTIQPANTREEQKQLENLIQYVFHRMEEIACESAVATPPDDMLFTVCHTIAGAKGLETKPVEHPLHAIEGSGLDGEWSLLANLFMSKDESDGQLASSWLLSLLVAVADKERLEGDFQNGSFNGRPKAMFPQLNSDAPSPKCSSGVESPALADFLRYVLSQPASAERTACRLVVVAKRLIIYLQTKYLTDAVLQKERASRAASVEDPMESVRSTLDFFLAANSKPEGLEAQRVEETPFIDVDPETNANLVLPVLSLLLEWLYEISGEHGRLARVEAAELLIECVTSRQEIQGRSNAAINHTSRSDWVKSQYELSSSEGTQASQEASKVAAKTQSKLTAFLSCTAACPEKTLSKLSPVFLSRLYQNLGDGSLPSQPSAKGMQAALWARDVRAAVFLLLLSRCSQGKAVLQQAGGEGMFIDLLADADPRVRFHAAVFLQQRLRTYRPEVYRRALSHIMQQALQNEDSDLLLSAHLQIHAMLDQKLIDFSV